MRGRIQNSKEGTCSKIRNIAIYVEYDFEEQCRNNYNYETASVRETRQCGQCTL